eukprot:3926740-Pyramimonas_sp.AAC.1
MASLSLFFTVLNSSCSVGCLPMPYSALRLTRCVAMSRKLPPRFMSNRKIEAHWEPAVSRQPWFCVLRRQIRAPTGGSEVAR